MLPEEPSIDSREGFSMCFGCGRNNPIGLKMRFSWDGQAVSSEFVPNECHQGWWGIVHGGIICAVLDEVVGNVAVYEGLDAVTGKIEVRIRRPVKVGEHLKLTGRLTRKTRKLAEAEAMARDTQDAVVAEATAVLYIVRDRGSEGNGPKAVIWDMDGVIVDTASIHYGAWRDAFARWGIAYTEELFRRSFGQRNDTIIGRAMGEVSPELIKAISEEKESLYRQRAPCHLRPLPGALGLLRALREQGFRMAIASSAPMENIEMVMSSLNIRDCFDALVSAREVHKGKPDPEVYLVAAQKLGVIPQRCVVIEDAVAGVEGARAGGMKAIAVTNTHPREKLAQADLVVDSLKEVDAAMVGRLLDSSRTVS